MSFTDSFLKSYSSADYLARQCIRDKEYCVEVLEELKDVIEEKKKRIEQLGEMLKGYMEQVDRLNKENRRMEVQLIDLYVQYIGMPLEAAQRMKDEYERGMSLRELANVFSCDKATVKRRLIKMGVKIRE